MKNIYNFFQYSVLAFLLLWGSLAVAQVALPADLTEANCKAKLLPDKTYALFNQDVSFRFFFPRDGNNNQLPFAVTSNLFFIKVATGGSIRMTLDEAEVPFANNLDYALWGPYDNLTDPGTKVLDTCVDFVTTATYPYGTRPTGVKSSVQSFNLTPRTGQYYLLFIDNVDKAARTFKMSFTSSNGGVIDASPNGDIPTISGQPASNAACPGGTLSLNVSATNATAYQWRLNNFNISGATGSTYTKTNFSSANSGKYDVIVSSGSGCYALSNAAVVTVGSGTAPTISGQPAGANTCIGQSATFAVTASGSSLSYQWRKNGANIPNANSASYSVGSVSNGDVGQYDVVVSGTCGTVISSQVSLTLRTPVTITSQPTAQVLCPGGPVTFQVAAAGTGIGYQWRKDGTNIANANSATYSLASVGSGDAGQYDVVVSGTCGNVTSNQAGLTVNTPVSITTQPTAQNTCPGGLVTFQVAASGTITGYQWRRDGTNIPNATDATLTLSNVGGGNAGQYDVIVAGPCGNVTSSQANLTVRIPASITTQPTAQALCPGGSVSFQVTASGEVASYQWRKNGTNIPNATNASLTLSNVASGDAGQYDVVLAGVCVNVTSNQAGLTVNTPVTISTQPTAQVACPGGSVTFQVAASGDGIGYQWRKDGTNLPNANNASLTVSNISSGNAGQYDVIVSGTCGNVTSNPAGLTVRTPISITTQPGNQVRCSGESVTFQVTASGDGIGYQWRKNGANIANANSAAYSLASVSSGDAGQYDVVVTGTCGNVTSSQVNLTVNTPVTISTQPVSQNICPGGSATLRVAASGTITGYQWRKDGANLAGATGASLVLTGLTNAASGQYDVVVQGVCGNVTSGASSLAVASELQLSTSSTPVACFQGNNGQASVSVSGGAGNYSYQWANRDGGPGPVTATSSGLTAGTYQVTVTDGFGCQKNASVTVSQPTAVVLSTGSTAVKCFGGGDGIATVTASGGVGNYTYRWTSLATTAISGGLNAGNYTVTVTDGNGCTKTASVEVTQPTDVVLSTSSTAVKCFGGNDGTATVTATGGTGAYSYRWSTGATTATVSGLAAGANTVTVTDANGCVKTVSISVGQPATLLTLTMGSTAVRCFNGNDGSAQVTATGGGSNYTYLWNTGATTSSITGLLPGMYTVTVTDNNGCVKSASVQVVQPTGVVIAANTTPVTCFGGNNGTATVSASGGVGNFSYLWNNRDGGPGATTATISNLTAGTYQVTVTDGNGCVSNISTTVTQPSLVVLNTGSTAVKCFGGGDGIATVTASGGVGNYTYRWTSLATTAISGGLNAGNYTVTVTDGNGCVKTASVEVTQPTAVVLTITSTAAKCFGGSDGVATVSASGGVDNYSYRWNSGATTATASGLAAGNYTVTVTDGNGCVKTASVEVTQPTLIVLSTSTTAAKCFGGSDGGADVTATGGVGTYTYRWSTGATTASVNNLSAGTHQVTVTDGNGCTKTATVQVSQPTEVVLTTSSTAVKCFGGNDGGVAVQVSGGTGAYSYRWNTGATTASVSGLIAGTYTVTVTDANGCIKTASVEVTQPAAVVLTMTSTAVKCFGGGDGIATVTASGGVGNYTYRWTSLATTAISGGLNAGNYTVTVTDGNGCVKTASVEVTQPTVVVLSINSTAAKCFNGNDGTATVTATGGVGGYSYRWNSGATTASAGGLAAGTYTVTVTDANGCAKTTSVEVTQPVATELTTGSTAAKCFGGNDGTANVTATGGVGTYTYRWSTGATTASVNGLVAGTYQVTVTDANGCARTASVEVTQPTLVVLSTSSTAVKCFGGNDGGVAVQVSGGTGAYSYRWNTGATTTTLNGLVAGTYTVTVTDANGCVKTASVEVTQPTVVALSITSTAVKCFGGGDGVASVLASGGIGNYTYQWTSGANTATSSGLNAGNYTVTVTDGNGCAKTASVDVTQPTVVVLSINSTAAKCFNGNDGTATVTATGGVGGYSYRWNSGATTASAGGLAAGTYTVTVTDANGCAKTASVEVTQPVQIGVSISNTPANCFGNADGTAVVTVNGGTGVYSYRWNTGATTAAISQLTAGQYQVTVSDANGCQRVVNTTVSQPTVVVLSTSSTAVKCFGGNDGIALVTASGGVGNYTYRWTTGTTTPTASQLITGTYTVTVTDGNGCVKASTVQVTQPTRLQFALQKENVNCFGGSDGKVTLNATGGVGNYQFTVNGTNPTGFASGGQHLLAGLSSATYQVAVTDGNACPAPVQSVSIAQPSQPVSISLTSFVNPRGFGLTDGSIQVAVSGGTLQYATNWQNTDGTSVGTGQSVPDGKGGITNTLTPLGDNTYTLTVRDANFNLATQKAGCTATVTQRLVQPAKLTLLLATTQPVACFGRRSARVLATADGGVPTDNPLKYTFQWLQQTGSAYTRLNFEGLEIQNLPAGSYRCIVTDKNSITQQADIVITEPAKLAAAASGIKDNLCFNDQKGTAVVTMKGGTQPYAVDWSNGAVGPALANLKAGRYLALVSDKNGCTAEVTVRIQEPQALALSVTTRKNPSCDDRCDGQIQTLVKGGVQPYSLSWGTGLPATAALSNLCGGNYTPSVRDANGCLVTLPAVDLVTPAAKTLTVSPDRTLCEGQSLQLDATQPGTNTYTWQLPNSSISNQAKQILSQAGPYSVTVTDGAGCSARSSFAIRVVPITGQLSFIMASQGFVGDTIVAINLSSGSNQFAWILPASVRVLSQTATQVRFVSAQPGTLSIGLRGSNGTCEAELYKTITIKPASGRRAVQVEPTSSALLVFPNPSEGTFRVQLSFGKVTDARLAVVNAQTGQPVHTKPLTGEATYDLPISLPDLPAGFYIVQVATATEQLTQRLLIVR